MLGRAEQSRIPLQSLEIMKRFLLIAYCLLAAGSEVCAAAPDYGKDISPLLNKYCAACHNADDLEGKLALDTFNAVIKGGEKGAVITPGSGAQSRLIRVLTGEAKPAMPPKDSDAPSAAEIAILKAWIDAGAKGPTGKLPDPADVATPKIKPTIKVVSAINAMAVSPQQDVAAYARFGELELLHVKDGSPIHKLTGHRGKVSAVAFSPDGSLLLSGAGEPALLGELKLWNVSTGECLKTWRGHRDSVYAVAFSPDSKTIASAGYDQSIKLWNIANDEPLHTIEGHNGAIFGLAFRKDGQVLASASEDRTVKLWNVADGTRLDTLSQSTKELYTLAFSPDGERLAAAGVDNRIRVWGISKTAQEGTNPLVFSHFAHDAAVLKIAFSPDGKTLLSSGEDRLVKIWNAANLTIRETLETQPDWLTGLAVVNDGKSALVTRLNGTAQRYDLSKQAQGEKQQWQVAAENPPEVDYGRQLPVDQLTKVAEVEPNDQPAQATTLAIPGVATGTIHVVGEPMRTADVDLYRIEAKANDQWIIETNAARSASMLDSKIEVLHADGRPVGRVLLRAVRDSEIEFRGMNSDQRGVRLKFWDEISLRQYIYLSGEVGKQFQQRRGPDADSQFYPEGGSRINYFDTTPRAHALGEPAYVVVPYPIGTELPNNGLPVFTLNYENDDDAQRKLGKDSRLTFIAPADGVYLVRVSDIRGFQADKFNYQLIVRRPQPSFKVTLSGANPEVGAGSGKMISARAERFDNFNGPITIDISGLPPGFTVTSPLTIEAGHYEAKGVIAALPHAPYTDETNWSQTKVAALAQVAGELVIQEVNNLGTIKLIDRPKVLVHLLPTEKSAAELAPPITTANRVFEVLDPAEAKSAGGATLTKQGDASILASELNPDADTYTIVARTDQRKIIAFRLEALGAESLPDKAPGRAANNGNFVVTEFSVTAAPHAKPEKAQPVKIKSVSVDYTQPGWSGAAMIDGDPKSGWAVADPGPKNTFPVKRRDGDPNHFAVFELAEPLDLEGGALLTFTMAQAGEVKQHNLGRFRLSVTTDAVAELPLLFPEIPEVTIVPGQETTCRLKVERHGFSGRIPVEVENLPHGVIVNDIGLNGVLINEQETERVIFLACEPWVAEQDRLFVAVVKVEGDQVSLPLRLKVRKP